MKRKTLLVTVLIMTAGVLSMPLVACGGLSFTTARLSETTMASSVDETTHQPIDKTDIFNTDTPVIFASAKLSNAPADTEVAAEWIYISGEVADLQNYTITTLSEEYDGDQYIYFSLSKSETAWPVGDYKVVLSINGKEQTSIPFTVVLASPTTAPPSPTTEPPSPTAPPSSTTTLPKPPYLLASDEQYLALVETFDSWGLDFDSLFTTYAQQDLEAGWDTMWLGSDEDESQRVSFYRVGDSWIPEDPAKTPPNLLVSDAQYQELRQTFDSWGLDFYSIFLSYAQQGLEEDWTTMWLGDDEDETRRVSFTRVGDNWQPDDAAPAEAGLANFQVISVIMPMRESSSSVATFTNTLKAGDVIQGFIELSGERKSVDSSFAWSAEIIDPEGETIDIFRGHWVKNNHYDLNIKVKDDGDYEIKVRHGSEYDKDLLINIQPKGWK